MNKKALGIFLMGTLSLCCSCIDDTYDVINKDISTDMQIKGNKLSLPLGSLCPIPLDSLLVDSLIDSIPILKVDKETRIYSLSLDSSLEAGVEKSNLEALKKVSELSADIAPIPIPIQEISFDPEAYKLTKNLQFGEVELSEITLNQFEEEITLGLEKFTLNPISIPGEKEPRSVKFNTPSINLNDITIEQEEAKEANFSINNIELNGVELSAIDKTISIDAANIDVTKKPKGFNHEQPLTLSDETLDGYLSLIPGGNNAAIPSPGVTIPIDTRESEVEEYNVNILFDYEIPEQIEKIDRIVLDPTTSEVKFVLVNPKIVSENNLVANLDFHIKFPEGYILSEEPGYNLSEDKNEIWATIPISEDKGDKTYVTFHLKEIGGLSDKMSGKGKISFNDIATCKIRYKVDGNVAINAGTTVGQIKEKLKYSFGLNVNFDVAEVYGSIQPVESEFTAQNVPFSFSIENLDYIKSINTVKLKDTKFQFTMGLDESFEHFDIADNSKFVLSFPDAFVFSTTGMKLPNGVKQSTTRANDFEITSFEAFSTTASWVLPISEIKINQEVTNGELAFSTQATVKAVTGSKDNYLAVKTKNADIDLIAAVNNLCKDRSVELKASAIELNIEDVTGATNTIDIKFDKQDFDLDFEIAGNLENVSYISFVEFDTDYPITITPSLDGNFGGIELKTGSGIAICFPENFKFDTDRSTLRYNETLKGFVIESLSQLEETEWKFYLQKIDVYQNVVNGTLPFNEKVTLKAINGNTDDTHLHIAGNDNFSLKNMREQGLLDTEGKTVSFKIKESPIEIKEVLLSSKEIDINFPSPEGITYPISIDGLKYITRIGSIEFEDGNNKLMFKTQVSGNKVDNLKLAEKSYIELKFPEVFKLDPQKSNVPQKGASFVDSSTIRITGLEALNHEWELAVKRIALNQEIRNQTFEQDYTITINSYSTKGDENKLTIAAIKNLNLTDILSEERELQISVEDSEIKISDVEVSIEDIGINFDKQEFTAPVPTIENLDLIKEIKHITFVDGENTIVLKISLDGDLGEFDLVNSKVKLCLPTAFDINVDGCNFGEIEGLSYNQTEKAIYIESIQSIINTPIKLAINKISINQKIENNQFNWEVKFSVESSNADNKLYIGCNDNTLRYSEVSPIMGEKHIKVTVEKAKLGIDEAVIVSNGVTETIEEAVNIPLNETISEAIDRVDFIGFAQPVPMILNISTNGLGNLDVPVKISADITLPTVFDISSNDKNVTITEEGLHIDTTYALNDNQNIEFQLLVHSLDFTTLDKGFLELTPNNEGGRILKYDGSAMVKGSVSINDATVSSDILQGVSMDLSFDIDKVVLKDFTGLYSGSIDAKTQNFELGLENGFDDLKESGITLSNTKPELMISIYNPIGVPVDVDLSIVGKDKDDNVIPTSVIAPKEILRIEPAKFNEQGELVADTTRWFFTSNEKAEAPAGYKLVVIENLSSLLDELPYSIDFTLAPTIVTENVKHHVDLTKLELGGSYAISVPFDLKFEQSIPLEFDEEIEEILNNVTLSLANPQLALAIHNPIADSLVFDLSIIGKDANGQPIETFEIDFTDEPFVLKAGVREEDGTITPTTTRWLFAVSEDIQREEEGYQTKVVPNLGSLLANVPHNIDIVFNAHFNTNITQQIDYNNDLNLLCEYDVTIPLQFSDLKLSYADTISDISLNLQETLDEMEASITNVELGIAMNLKNTLPLGLKLNLIPLDAQNNPIQGIEIESINIRPGNGAAIAEEAVIGTPVELAIKCDHPDTLSALDKIAFKVEVESGNGDHALSGKQGIQVCDIVLQVKCDAEMDLGKLNY